MISALISITSLFLFLLLAISASASQADEASETDSDATPGIEYVLGLVNQRCGNCHPVPAPSLMPKKSWPGVIQAMAALSARRMEQEFITPDDLRHITAYYYGSSPESLPLLPYFDSGGSSRTFAVSELGSKSNLPLVTNVMAAELATNGGNEFLVCDGEGNRVLLLTQTDGLWPETLLAEVPAPSHTQVIDYDGDGDNDIVVAALGLLHPSAELAGKVFLLRQSAPGRFDPEVLLEGVGRVTDARAVDVDNDDDLDLAVAVFGGGTIGEVSWLENLGAGKHAKHVLLNLSGALNVSPIDLNADGRIDLVSLITQEHEMFVAFMNRGNGEFEQVLLARGPHPMYGSTGMKLIDLDRDGDVDILFTNGDAFDTQSDPKPYHGVQWLENKGELVFQFHDIGRFYGAATAVAGDMDGDGDLDVVAGSWVNFWEDPRRQSLVWFENDGKQNFTGRNILSKPPGIVSLALKDIDDDGQLDILAAALRMDLLVNMLREGTPREESAAGAQSLEPRLLLLINRAAGNVLPDQSVDTRRQAAQ